MKILELASSVLFLLACGSKPPEPTPAPAGAPTQCEVPDWKTPTGEPCLPSRCGGNSPLVNSFPIGGVSSAGRCNITEGVQLVPGSIEGGACKGGTLDLHENQLVARDAKTGEILCQGEQLENSTFALRNWNKKEARIKIDKVQHYEFQATHEKRFAYRMVSLKNPNESLCAANAAIKFRAELEIEMEDWNKVIKGTDAATSDLAIAVRSELYHLDGKPVKVRKKWAANWETTRVDWVHFACVEDALAKRSFYDLYTDNVERSRAALRMLTADYCGSGLPATRRGLKIDWSGTSTNPLEASWSEKGARCLTDARLLYSDGPTQQLPSNPPSWLPYCKNPPCTSPTEWLKQARHCVTVDEYGKPESTWDIKDKCDDCPAGGCNPRELRSSVVPQ